MQERCTREQFPDMSSATVGLAMLAAASAWKGASIADLDLLANTPGGALHPVVLYTDHHAPLVAEVRDLRVSRRRERLNTTSLAATGLALIPLSAPDAAVVAPSVPLLCQRALSPVEQMLGATVPNTEEKDAVASRLADLLRAEALSRSGPPTAATRVSYMNTI